jgi:hypothetical protein
MATDTEASQGRGKKTRRVGSEDLVDQTKKKTRGGHDIPGASGGRGERPAEETMHEKVVKLIDAVCTKIFENKDKVTVADLVRLMQIEKELRPQGCERMVVEWVDSMPEEG